MRRLTCSLVILAILLPVGTGCAKLSVTEGECGIDNPYDPHRSTKSPVVSGDAKVRFGCNVRIQQATAVIEVRNAQGYTVGKNQRVVAPVIANKEYTVMAVFPCVNGEYKAYARLYTTDMLGNKAESRVAEGQWVSITNC